MNARDLHKLKPRTTKQQVGAFALTGIINTGVDFLLLNIGIFVFHIPILIANIISTSLALLCSYGLNKGWVFGGHRGNKTRAIMLFLLVTLTGLYVLQTGIIYLLTSHFPHLGNAFYAVLQVFHIPISNAFVIANIAKAVATVATAIWNFVWYKKVVFASRETT